MPRSTSRGDGVRVALVASEFNYDVTYLMVERAREEIDFLGAVAGPLVKTPGVFDIRSPRRRSSSGATSTPSWRSGPSSRGRPATTRWS